MKRKERVPPKQTLFTYFKPIQTPPYKEKGSRDDRKDQENEEPKVKFETTPTRTKQQLVETDSDEDNIGRTKVLFVCLFVCLLLFVIDFIRSY